MYKVRGSKGGNQLVLIYSKTSRCILEGTKRNMNKYKPMADKIIADAKAKYKTESRQLKYFFSIWDSGKCTEF